MSIVLKRLFVRKKEKPSGAVVLPLDTGAPNDDRAYAKRIEDRIVVRLIEEKAAVEHVERKRDLRSQRLNEDRIQKMVRLDELFFKYAESNIGM